MVTIFKDIPIAGIEIIPCRVNGPRGIVKSFLLYDEETLVAVDTGFNDADTDTIVDRIRALGRQPSDLTMCILTHNHGDHTGGLRKLRTVGDFAVISHERDAEGILKTSGVKVDRIVTEGDRLPFMGGVRVIHMPGHTYGSVALYVEREEALVAGDAIVSAGEHLMVSPPYLSDDSQLARESVQRLLGMQLPIDKVLVGHGDDIHAGAAGPLSRILAERRAV